MLYENRQDAGLRLAEKLEKYAHENPIVIALPRGGVVVGSEVAKKLKAPFDVIIARKIGAPFNPEFGIGAIAPNDIRVLDPESISLLDISEAQINHMTKIETIEMNRQIRLYRKNMPELDLKDKTVILVDDGLATGVSIRAALLSIKQMRPKKVILAVPVSPLSARVRFKKEADEFLSLYEDPSFYAVGAYYQSFEQVQDDVVISLIQKLKNRKSQK